MWFFSAPGFLSELRVVFEGMLFELSDLMAQVLCYYSSSLRRSSCSPDIDHSSCGGGCGVCSACVSPVPEPWVGDAWSEVLAASSPGDRWAQRWNTDARVKWKEVAVGPNSTCFKGALCSPVCGSLCVFVYVSGSFIKIQILGSEFLLTDERECILNKLPLVILKHAKQRTVWTKWFILLEILELKSLSSFGFYRWIFVLSRRLYYF